MADVKPFFVIFLCFALVDVVTKLTVADLIANVYGRCYCHNSAVGARFNILLSLIVNRLHRAEKIGVD